jgi:hypothetical protein
VLGYNINWDEILTEVKTSMLVFWVATPCGLAGR